MAHPYSGHKQNAVGKRRANKLIHGNEYADGGEVKEERPPPSRGDMARPRVGPFSEDATLNERPRVGPFPREPVYGLTRGGGYLKNKDRR